MTDHGADASRDEGGLRQTIARAKREWEYTVDALDHLVCLIDGRQRVVRVNRVIERWSLGSVADAVGKDIHVLLHGECRSAECELARHVQEGWQRLQTGEAAEFELRDATLERALHVSMRPTLRRGDASLVDETRAVLVVSDVTVLQLAQEALHALNAGLESRVRARTRDLADANRDLKNEIVRREAAEKTVRQSSNELALLTEQLINAQESERKRIARELHDTVGQALSAIKYGLERAEVLARQGRMSEARPALERAVVSVQSVIEEIRSIAMNLRPSVLDDLGAASAVTWFCREFIESYPFIELSVRIDLDDGDIPPRLGTALFRSVQELLNNVARHAQARHARVALEAHDTLLLLEVSDDGIGIDSGDTVIPLRHGHGIRNLRERADMTGGRFTLAPSPGGGTLARIEWTLGADERAAEGRKTCLDY
jgi:signal transduction histidine kinase